MIAQGVDRVFVFYKPTLGHWIVLLVTSEHQLVGTFQYPQREDACGLAHTYDGQADIFENVIPFLRPRPCERHAA